jgi:hypothetical protein
VDLADLPRPIGRALREIQAHPRVVGVRVKPAEPRVDVEIDVDSGLPSRWDAAGASPNGARAVETVAVVFPDSFPSKPPRFYLREDFDRSHPHIQPATSGPPEPCLLNGSTAELMRSRGVTGLIDQLALWLTRAAFTQLIDPSQGWEPVRRDRIDDYVVVDSEMLRAMATAKSDCRVMPSWFGAAGKGAERLYVVGVGEGSGKIDESLVQRWSDKNNNSCLSFVTWSGKRPSGDPFVANKYLPETISDLRGLLERAAQYGCGEELPSKLSLLAMRLRGRKLPHPVPVVVILIARRPCNIIGEESPLEICPYLILVNGDDDLDRRSAKVVRIASQIDRISTRLLRRASGSALEDSAHWALIGCGSVGSKLAIHLARAGRAPALVVDRTSMRPHNFARHALLPGVAVQPSKARAIAEAISAFGQGVKHVDCDVMDEIAHGKFSKLAAVDTKFVVNSTGSLAVRETLCKSGLERPPIVECCLMGAGRIGYMSIEGPAANPSSVDLAAEAYALMGRDDEMPAVAFSAPPVEIEIGAGCSSLTFPMSDARLSALTAPMAEHLERALGQTVPSSYGELLIGLTPEDGLGQRWLRRRVPPFIEVGDGKLRVRISASVHERIAMEVAAKPGKETGGVIIGRWSDVTESFHVVDLLPAPPDSKFSPHRFTLGTQGLTEALRDVHDRTGGALYALGTWHNHLVVSDASWLDANTAAILALHQFFPALLLIHVPGGYRILVADALFDPRTHER